MTRRHLLPCKRGRCGALWDLSVPYGGSTAGLVLCHRLVETRSPWSPENPGECGLWREPLPGDQLGLPMGERGRK